MSLANGFTWTHDDITLKGYSIAGITTSVAFPDADVCFDVGQGLPFQIPFRTIALTHGHLDHASGLPYLLGQKAMHGAPAPNVYMPKPLVAPMTEIIRIWSEIEEHTLKLNLEGIQPGDERPLKGKFFLKTFPTYHRIPSHGYTVFLKKKRLLPAFQGLTPPELGQHRKAGTVIDEHFSEPIVSFTGDTKIEVLQDENVRRSRVLVLECTYWDEAKPIEKAREWGHIHLYEIIPWLDKLECEKLLLIHSSARYSLKEITAIMDEKIPAKHRARVEVFPRF